MASVKPQPPDTAQLADREVGLWVVAPGADGRSRAHDGATTAAEGGQVAAAELYARLRTAVLAAQSGLNRSELAYARAAGGKPRLAEGCGVPWLRFNGSHTGRGAAIAVARGREVGVDLESVAPLADLDRLIERACTERERRALAAIPHARRAHAFLLCWTRKEAYLKARGDGLTRDLRQIDVSLSAAWSPIPTLVVDSSADGRWGLLSLAPTPDLLMAVCAAGDQWRPRTWIGHR